MNLWTSYNKKDIMTCLKSGRWHLAYLDGQMASARAVLQPQQQFWRRAGAAAGRGGVRARQAAGLPAGRRRRRDGRRAGQHARH